MKPAVFEFVRARTIGEATALLSEANGAARVVAGAQSLGPMLNLRLVQPQLMETGEEPGGPFHSCREACPTQAGKIAPHKLEAGL